MLGLPVRNTVRRRSVPRVTRRALGRLGGGPLLLNDGGSSRAWRRLRAAVLARDGFVCRVPVLDGRIDPAGRPCLLPASTADHIVPRALGGDDDPDNLRAACSRHNSQKGGRLDADASPGSPRSAGWAW